MWVCRYNLCRFSDSDLVENYSHKQIEEGLIVCAIRISAITGDVCLKTSAINSMYLGAVANPGKTAGAIVAAVGVAVGVTVATVGVVVYAVQRIVKRMRRHRRTDGCGVCTSGDENQDHYHGGTLA